MNTNGGRNRPRDLIAFPGTGIGRATGARRIGNLCRAIARAVGDFYREEDGQAVTEYILLLSGTVIGAGLLARGILNALDSGILKLGGALEKDLKTGRAPLSVYQN